MPPRTRKRKRTSKTHLLAFRTGGLGAGGSRHPNPDIIRYKAVVASKFLSSAVSAGDHLSFNLGGYNTPLRMIGNVTWINPVGISDQRHPTGHVQAIEDGYNTALVKGIHYHIYYKWQGADSVENDFIIAYKFDTDSTASTPALTASVVTMEMWLDLQASPGWVWRRGSCNGRTSAKGLQSAGFFDINIPELQKLQFRMHKSSTSDLTIDSFKTIIGDNVSDTGVDTFLHIMWFRIPIDGITYSTPAIAADDFTLEIRCTLDCELYKQQGAEDLIDEGDNV